MQAIERGYRGVRLLVSLNADLFYSVAALAGSLALAAWIATTL